MTALFLCLKLSHQSRPTSPGEPTTISSNPWGASPSPTWGDDTSPSRSSNCRRIRGMPKNVNAVWITQCSQSRTCVSPTTCWTQWHASSWPKQPKKRKKLTKISSTSVSSLESLFLWKMAWVCVRLEKINIRLLSLPKMVPTMWQSISTSILQNTISLSLGSLRQLTPQPKSKTRKRRETTMSPLKKKKSTRVRCSSNSTRMPYWRSFRYARMSWRRLESTSSHCGPWMASRSPTSTTLTKSARSCSALTCQCHRRLDKQTCRPVSISRLKGSLGKRVAWRASRTMTSVSRPGRISTPCQLSVPNRASPRLKSHGLTKITSSGQPGTTMPWRRPTWSPSTRARRKTRTAPHSTSRKSQMPTRTNLRPQLTKDSSSKKKSSSSKTSKRSLLSKCFASVVSRKRRIACTWMGSLLPTSSNSAPRWTLRPFSNSTHPISTCPASSDKCKRFNSTWYSMEWMSNSWSSTWKSSAN